MQRLLVVALVVALCLAPFAAATNTYAQALNYARNTPKRDGGSWAGWCASLMVRAGNFPDWAVRPNAIGAYRSSTIVSTNWNTAPRGAMHWWDIGADGHVAMATDPGWALMASNKVQQPWGDAIGVTPLDAYTQQTGGRYLGWSYDYAGATIADIQRVNVPPSGGVPQTNTAATGVVDTAYNMRLQLFASKNGYTGPIDGSLGVNSWKGVQTGLRAFGYSGPIDGVPGSNTYMAMQRAAQKYGYTGPIDGALGPNSYKGFAKFLNTL